MLGNCNLNAVHLFSKQMVTLSIYHLFFIQHLFNKNNCKQFSCHALLYLLSGYAIFKVKQYKFPMLDNINSRISNSKDVGDVFDGGTVMLCTYCQRSWFDMIPVLPLSM